MKRLIRLLMSSIYFKLLPLLILCIVIIKFWILPANLVGDEGRYIEYAQNLLNGYYSPPYPNISLSNGPGYPLFIAPFIYFKMPLFAIRLINAILLYFSLIFVYKTLVIYSPKNISFFFTVLLGVYFPSFQMLRFIHTETLTWFFISLICYYFIIYYRHNPISLKYLLLSSFSIAFLSMIKVIFGYVIIFMLIASLILYLIPNFRTSAKKAIFVFCISLIFCTPYLTYTYNLTSKFFYWTNIGSMSLYTMSTPYADEFGDWSRTIELQSNPNHKVFMDSIATLYPLERADAYKKAAIENISNHPNSTLTN